MKKDLRGLITDWENFYKEVFKIKVDFSNLRIPNEKVGFNRLIIVAKGMTPQRLYDKCKKLFPCWKCVDDGDFDKIQSDRTAEDDPYAIWIRKRVEADEKLKNFSADDLKKQNILSITLEERLLYELKYFKRTGKHLDNMHDIMTLCAGSRYDDNLVPLVHWSERFRELRVGSRYSSDDKYSLRSRAVIS